MFKITLGSLSFLNPEAVYGIKNHKPTQVMLCSYNTDRN